MNYYIKGNKERGAEVIALLESKGGKNVDGLVGIYGGLYYIDKCHTIHYTCSPEIMEVVCTLCQKLTLPEKKEWKPKFKIGDEVDFITTLTHGTITEINSHEKTYTIRTGHIETVADEAHISLHKWEPKRGETVLVRNCPENKWREAIFSFKNSIDTGEYYEVVGGTSYKYCIPFDINKLGKVTND